MALSPDVGMVPVCFSCNLSAYFNTHTFQRNAPPHNGHFWGGALRLLRDDAKNGCEGD